MDFEIYDENSPEESRIQNLENLVEITRTGTLEEIKQVFDSTFNGKRFRSLGEGAIDKVNRNISDFITTLVEKDLHLTAYIFSSGEKRRGFQYDRVSGTFITKEKEINLESNQLETQHSRFSIKKSSTLFDFLQYHFLFGRGLEIEFNS